MTAYEEGKARMDEPSGRWLRSSLAIGIVALTIASLLPLLDMTSSPGAAQDKLYHLAANAIIMKVIPNGSLRIRETLTFRFDLGTFSFAYRDIPWRGFDDLQDVSVTNETGWPLDFSLRFAPEETGEWHIRWSFASATAPAVRTFTVGYTVTNALLQPSAGLNRLDLASGRHGMERLDRERDRHRGPARAVRSGRTRDVSLSDRDHTGAGGDESDLFIREPPPLHIVSRYRRLSQGDGRAIRDHADLAGVPHRHRDDDLPGRPGRHGSPLVRPRSRAEGRAPLRGRERSDPTVRARPGGGRGPPSTGLGCPGHARGPSESREERIRRPPWRPGETRIRTLGGTDRAHGKREDGVGRTGGPESGPCTSPTNHPPRPRQRVRSLAGPQRSPKEGPQCNRRTPRGGRALRGKPSDDPASIRHRGRRHRNRDAHDGFGRPALVNVVQLHRRRRRLISRCLRNRGHRVRDAAGHSGGCVREGPLGEFPRSHPGADRIPRRDESG